MNTVSLKEVDVTWAGENFLLRLKEGRPYQLLFKKVPASFSNDSHFWSQELFKCLLEKPLYPIEGGSEFQQSVWREITKIPWGELRTYSEIAHQLGRPQAVRAVANACGQNPLPLFIPCHRVVGKNDWGGYNGGVNLKIKLLRLEGHNI